MTFVRNLNLVRKNPIVFDRIIAGLDDAIGKSDPSEFDKVAIAKAAFGDGSVSMFVENTCEYYGYLKGPDFLYLILPADVLSSSPLYDKQFFTRATTLVKTLKPFNPIKALGEECVYAWTIFANSGYNVELLCSDAKFASLWGKFRKEVWHDRIPILTSDSKNVKLSDFYWVFGFSNFLASQESKTPDSLAYPADLQSAAYSSTYIETLVWQAYQWGVTTTSLFKVTLAPARDGSKKVKDFSTENVSTVEDQIKERDSVFNDVADAAEKTPPVSNGEAIRTNKMDTKSQPTAASTGVSASASDKPRESEALPSLTESSGTSLAKDFFVQQNKTKILEQEHYVPLTKEEEADIKAELEKEEQTKMFGITVAASSLSVILVLWLFGFWQWLGRILYNKKILRGLTGKLARSGSLLHWKNKDCHVYSESGELVSLMMLYDLCAIKTPLEDMSGTVYTPSDWDARKVFHLQVYELSGHLYCRGTVALGGWTWYVFYNTETATYIYLRPASAEVFIGDK